MSPEGRENPLKSISVPCPCGKRLRVDASAAGKKVRCPGCKALVPVPAGDPPAALVEPSPPPEVPTGNVWASWSLRLGASAAGVVVGLIRLSKVHGHFARNMMAVGTFVGLICGFAAAGLGVWGIYRIVQDGGRGMGRAVTGIVLGGLAGTLCLIAALDSMGR